ncbi:MAG: sigma factor-like helix-turn-helix DNA-binding protein [Myxococcota bacterium]
MTCTPNMLSLPKPWNLQASPNPDRSPARAIHARHSARPPSVAPRPRAAVDGRGGGGRGGVAAVAERPGAARGAARGERAAFRRALQPLLPADLQLRLRPHAQPCRDRGGRAGDLPRRLPILRKLPGQSSLSWIYGIAKNTTNNAIRRSRSQSERIELADDDELAPRTPLEGGAPDEALDLQVFGAQLAQRLERLADWQMEIFELRHFENLSIPEISERTRRSSDAVRSSLDRVKRIFFEAAAVGGSPSSGEPR